MSGLMRELPAVPLRAMTILPGMITHFDISRASSVRAVEAAIQTDSNLFLITQREANDVDPDIEDLYGVGVISEVKQVIKMQNDILRVIVEGKKRAEIASISDESGYLCAQVVLFVDDRDRYPREMQNAMLCSLQEALLDYCAANPKVGKELHRQLDGLAQLDSFLDIVSISLPLSYQNKQKLLEAASLQDRYEVLLELLLSEASVIRIKNELQKKVKERVDKNQREYILREEMKVIREELGEDDSFSDAENFTQELKKLKAPKQVRERIEKEIERFKNIAPNAPESTVVRTYIETLLELPWEKKSREHTDLKNAKEILEADHYGLEKVKERILEFLAVRCLTKKGDSPIICLVGPPGTGKTSIARSVARALNRKYVRICLGGVRDEAEIRGHRRTYIGAMPGRIVQGIRQAGTKNPLMLLDEVDKMSSDYRGDTASALLEVLDSEQNCRFVDHYVDIPVDLSEVLFIATANDMQAIPRPLLDRMEVIEVSSYTENEKLHIAKEHLLEKQKKMNGLLPEQFSISERALGRLIRGYTREAGVRSLERRIGELCRKAAREIYEGKQKTVHVKDKNLEKYLGKERYSQDMINETDEVGIARGLAWTSVGGDTLQIEVNIMPGEGEFCLTGQLGDVMKESAQAGISYIRSVSSAYGIDPEFFSKNDIHIHIPEGAVPKDGPSAGITMATAMISAIAGQKVRADVAMTGEITLRGRVLPVGGLKEKLLAAKNAGFTTVCVPEKNRPDVEEIDREIKKGLNICYVSTMKQVLNIALAKTE